MGWIFGSFVAFAVFLTVTIMWGSRRFRRVQTDRGIAPSAVAEVARVDTEQLRSLPQLAPSVAKVSRRTLRKDNDGRPVVAGVLVFGPPGLTWAPDDRAKRCGVTAWRLPWTEVQAMELVDGTSMLAGSATVTLAGGGVLHIGGIDASRARTAMGRFGSGANAPAEPGPTAG